ncbi:HTH_Tnp_Tc3_2 domain-containing protein [Trichonephila clavipes]|nr:HTH_Tnp_Tc3_2 domain-containing protein [Trichonephila clavipes]
MFHNKKKVENHWSNACALSYFLIHGAFSPYNSDKQKCRESWPTLTAEKSFTVFLDIILLILPLVLMTVTYSLIIRTLWQAMVISSEESEPSRNHQMARIVRHNDESVREGYIRNGGKEVKLFTIALKAFQCNNRIVMAQRKYLDDFLRGRINGRLECERTQLEVSEELGIAQSFLSRLWQRFQDDGNLSSATGKTVSRQTVYRRLGHIRLYARWPVKCVPLTATHCHLRLAWSREHALWTPQQWSCVMFSDESRFSLQSDSRQTLIWRAPGTRYHQENTIE